jgi:hypothetical protein
VYLSNSWTHEQIVRPDPDVTSRFERCSTPTLAYFDILLEFLQLLQCIDTSELEDCLVLQTAQPLSCTWAGPSGVSLLLLARFTPSFPDASPTNTGCNERVESLREASTVECETLQSEKMENVHSMQHAIAMKKANASISWAVVQ